MSAIDRHSDPFIEWEEANAANEDGQAIAAGERDEDPDYDDEPYWEPDEPDWGYLDEQQRAEKHSDKHHAGGPCDCPEPPRRTIELPAGFPWIVVLCGSTRFYDQFQQANYDMTMKGRIVLSVGFYPHAKAAHGHGEGVGHDSAEKAALDELHKRKIDLADEVLVVSDESGYFGDSTASEIAYANSLGKPVSFANEATEKRAESMGLIVEPPF